MGPTQLLAVYALRIRRPSSTSSRCSCRCNPRAKPADATNHGFPMSCTSRAWSMIRAAHDNGYRAQARPIRTPRSCGPWQRLRRMRNEVPAAATVHQVPKRGILFQVVPIVALVGVPQGSLHTLQWRRPRVSRRTHSRKVPADYGGSSPYLREMLLTARVVSDTLLDTSEDSRRPLGSEPRTLRQD